MLGTRVKIRDGPLRNFFVLWIATDQVPVSVPR